MAEQGGYDLMLVDLMLPGLDGIAVMREALRREPDQRMMVMSAISDVDTKVRCLDMGALDYLVKPIQLGELIARVRSRLRQATRSRCGGSGRCASAASSSTLSVAW